MFIEAIRRWFGRAAARLRGTGKPTNLPGFLRPIDTDSIARELDVVRIGTERGHEGLPPPDARTLDATEQQIVQRIESEWAWQGGELVNNLRAYAQRLVGYSVDAEFSRLEIQAKDTLAKLREADHRAEAELGPLRETFLATRLELENFRKRHHLSRAARDASHRVLTAGILASLIGVESALNGVFFAKGAELGLIGGIGTAIGISLTNIVACFLLGLWPARWVNHRNWLVKLTGLVLTISGICAAIALHAFAAHYRDAIATVGEDRALAAALNSLTVMPWRLADINSYYLFALGLLFTLGAIYKGVTFDDPYPRYGSTSRRADDARLSYSEEHSMLFDDLANIKDDTVQRLDEGIQRIPLFPQQAGSVRAQRAAMIQTFRGYESTTESAANQLLALYRETNRRCRTTSSPDHFDRVWRLPHSFLDSAEVRTLTADENQPPPRVDEILAELRRLSRDVLTEYERLMMNYPHPTRMT